METNRASLDYANILLWMFIALKFVLQYLAIDSGYELHRDEYLHLDLGRHLDWGYLSVPPVTALISFLVIKLGNSVFWVKFFPALFGSLIIVVVWKTIEYLKGGIFALVLGATCVTFSALIRINTLYQPNSLEFLMWTLVFYCLVRYAKDETDKWLYLAAVSFAIGFLNKYNIIFMALGLVPAMLITDLRKLFTKKQFYYAVLLALLLVLPNLIWQYVNEFPVANHMRELSERQLVNVNRFDFLREQLFFFAGSLLVVILGLISFLIYSPHRNFRFLFWGYTFTIFLYFLLRAKGYYAMGLYPIIIAFGALYMEHLLKKGWLFYLRIPLIISPVVTMIILFPIVMPALPPEAIIERNDEFKKLGLLRWEDGQDHLLPQDFADMLGWKELASVVDSALALTPDPKKTIIHCDNYGQAGGINFYSKRLVVPALSLNADYINWYPLEEMVIENVILVQEAEDEDPDRERERELFENVYRIGGITNQYARELGTSVYLLQGAKQSINQILKDEIQERKNR